MVVRFMEIGNECYRLQAFCVTQTIMAAFGTPPLQRLSHTWREVDKIGGPKLLAKWEEVKADLVPGAWNEADEPRPGQAEALRSSGGAWRSS